MTDEAWEPFKGKLVSGYSYGGMIEMLVDVSDYTGDPLPEIVWVPVKRVASGTAAVYPLKGDVPNGHDEGQWAPAQVHGFRCRPAWMWDEMKINYEQSLEHLTERGEQVIDCANA